MFMNIGKRIEQKLMELGWERKDLLVRVDGLSVQALSNLIRRGSKRSEWDEKIADALGVSVLWLVYGKSTPDLRQPSVVYTIEPESKRDTVKNKITAALDGISDDGLLMLLGKAEEISERFPKLAKQTQS